MGFKFSAAMFDTILHDVLALGTIAASIYVKNPLHQESAAKLINASALMLKLLDSQLVPASDPMPAPTSANTGIVPPAVAQ